MEEWGVERGLGRQYDGCYRVFDRCVAGCCLYCCMVLCGYEGGGEVGVYVD